MIGGGLEMRSLAAVAGRKLASFHGADGADALQLQGSASGILVRLLTFSPISGRSEN